MFISCADAQVIEELFTYWNLDDADETLEELEDALIVSPAERVAQTVTQLMPAECGCV
jgi:hypothetical protein